MNLFEKLKEERSVSIKTLGDMESLKRGETDHRRNIDSAYLYVGTLNTPLSKEFGPTEIKDSDGEVVSIQDLNLVLAGSIADDLPEMKMKPECMKDFAIAVAKTGTYNQRHLPLWQKFVILWKIFAELFLGQNYFHSSDPYIKVTAHWCKKQQIQAPTKTRIKVFIRKIRDMFVFVPSAEPVETFGMPGFKH